MIPNERLYLRYLRRSTRQFDENPDGLVRQRWWERNRANGRSALRSESRDLQMFRPLPVADAGVRDKCALLDVGEGEGPVYGMVKSARTENNTAVDCMLGSTSYHVAMVEMLTS